MITTKLDPTAEEIAQQFHTEMLETRHEIYSKDVENPNPTVPAPDCPTCPVGN